MASPASSSSELSTRALGRVIAAKAREIEERWLVKVRAEIAQRPDVELTHLRDGIPDYLAALAKQLEANGDREGSAIWADVAREHGITRVQSGFDIDQLVREFIVLRGEIIAEAIASRLWTAETASLLADLIEAAIVESVRSYVEARDYQIRRLHAEHVGFLTHELRNPLATAISATSLLREAAIDESRALDALERSHARLNRLIDRVLEAERLESGTLTVQRAKIRERDLLDVATEAARKIAQEKGLAFVMNVAPDRVLDVDRDLTRSAIQNLADNAVKYTDHGKVEITTSADDTNWFMHVRDTCPGLSHNDLRAIFEPFRRGATTKHGTGLGLAIARRAIELQGGSIGAESPGPVGCHFWITLPKRQR